MGAANAALYRYEPDHAVPPGETLREVLDDLDMSQADLARRAGLSAKTVNQIAQGIAPLSHDTALALEKVTGVPARVWNSLEAQWQEHVARQHEADRLADEEEWLETLPVHELKERGWLPDDANGADLVRAVCRFFGVANRDAWYEVWQQPHAAFRRSDKFTIKEGATAAWLRIGELKAQQIDCTPYDERRFRSTLETVRDLTVEDPDLFLPELVRRCAASGVAFVLEPEISGTRATGATQWLSTSKALIQLSLRYRWEDIFWFSFFHEAGHILLHGKRDVFLEGEDGDVLREREADEFAANLLIPPRYRHELRSIRRLDQAKAFADKLGISVAIVVGRLQHDRILDFSVGNHLRRRFKFRRQP